MHDSLIDKVKIHIDDILTLKEDGTSVKGWCASDSIEIEDVRVVVDNDTSLDSFEGEYKTERKDVYEFYEENECFLNSGFSIDIPQTLEDSGEDVFLQILHNDKWKNVKKLDSPKPSKKSLVEANFEINNTFDTNAIVVDNFYEDPHAIREFALSQEFVHHKEYHKGRRTEQTFIPKGLKEIFEKIIQKKVTWCEGGANGVFQYCTSEDPLVYHVDPQSYAGAIYLTPNAPAECGTTLFRSKTNGLLSAPTDEDAKRLGKTKEHLTAEVFGGGFYDKTRFEKIDVIGNVFNRLALWDAKLIHCASEYFGTDKNDSRLFQLFFFNVEEE